MDKSWRVILAFAGIFVAGMVAGVLVAPRVFDQVAGRRGGPGFQGRPPIQRNQPLGPQLFRQFTEQLNLTPEQREKIKPIELRVTEELRRARRDSQNETQKALERMQDEISEVLTPEQRTRFQERIAQSRERVQRGIQEFDSRGRREPGSPPRPLDVPPPK